MFQNMLNTWESGSNGLCAGFVLGCGFRW